jgi:hypothetical protein
MNDVQKIDDASLEKVRQAAEETAWLVERGYPTEATVSFVSQHRELGPSELRWLDCGTRANRSYRHHIARELDAEDVARRPLRIDTASVIATIEAGLRGAPLLEGMAGVLCDPSWSREHTVVGEATEEALEIVGKALLSLRPKSTRWFVDSATRDADKLVDLLAQADSRWSRVAVEVERVPNVIVRLRGAALVASTDPAVLDECASWLNLAALALTDRSDTRVLSFHG